MAHQGVRRGPRAGGAHGLDVGGGQLPEAHDVAVCTVVAKHIARLRRSSRLATQSPLTCTSEPKVDLRLQYQTKLHYVEALTSRTALYSQHYLRTASSATQHSHDTGVCTDCCTLLERAWSQTMVGKALWRATACSCPP